MSYYRTNPAKDWLIFVAGMTVFIIIMVAFTNAVISSDQSGTEEFHQDCDSQGGRYVVLNNSPYCIVDGVKISRW